MVKKHGNEKKMARSKWKGPFIHKYFFKSKKDSFKSWSRSTTIVPSFVGKIFNIYNGQRFVQIRITNLMIGHKLGEFVQTRKVYSYKK
jgi:small subunit ribosomal protein S19